MPVSRSCPDGDLAVIVRPRRGEYLLYRIIAGVDDVEYSLVTEDGTVIADTASCPGPCEQRWPSPPGAMPSDRDQQHVLGLQFLSEGSVDYEVTKHASDDSVLDTVKQCRFTLSGEPDSFFEPLRVLVR